MRRTTKEERDLFVAAVAAEPRKPRLSRAVKRRARKKAAEAPEEPMDRAGKRRTTPKERELFEAAASGRSPVKKAVATTRQTAVPAPKPAPPQPSGLDGNTARKLKRGELVPGAKIDLHGLTEAAAHRALTAFVLAAHRRGDRLVLIVTGKGGPSLDPERKRGVLKLMVPRWLEEAPTAKLIADKRRAHVRHGGEGALYVYLRKAKA